MTSTVQSLYNVYNIGGSLSNGILHDLFGINNLSQNMQDIEYQEYIDVIDGLYNGMWKINIPVKEIEKAFRQNKLDDLIYRIYNNTDNKYYRKYIKSNFTIVNTFYKF